MCEAPRTLWIGRGSNARQIQASCHECKQCRAATVRDWAGRNIAESKTAVAAHAVSLTYGRSKLYGSVDHERSVLLTYSDVQKWFKLLRRHGYPVRYFVTGEYGGTKGRAHWHVMLYWLKDVPPGLRLDEDCVNQNYWDHGFSHYTEPNYRQVWYNCKYILKGQGELEQRVLPRMSKKPPLGFHYFQNLAREYARQGIAPQSLEYTFPEVRTHDNQLFRFRLRGVSRNFFVQGFMDAWKELHGSKPRPVSQLVDDFEDWGKIVNPETFEYRTADGLEKNHSLRDDPRGPVVIRDVEAYKRARARDIELKDWIENQAFEKAMGWSQEQQEMYVVEEGQKFKDVCACAACVTRRATEAGRNAVEAGNYR